MIQIYNSLEAKKVPLNKEPGEEVKIYVCGPTVYDHAHLGHGRSAVAFDIVRKYLEFAGFKVIFVFNTTDIDDKMINRAKEENIEVEELAQRMIPEYQADYGLLNVASPTHNPQATHYIQEMIDLITTLEKNGCTYELEDGIYFDITKFTDYGKLSHQKLDELEAGARVEERKDKRNHQDFVLWKFKKEGEPFWSSPWGEGRPGWHIECSAMSQALLGDSFDIHGGGLDLKFPHHECEIAQSEAATKQEFARIWMHNGYITVNKEKMSKSLGNFFTLKEIFEKYDPRVVRYFLLSTHYRSPIEYNLDLLEQAKQTLKSIDEFYLKNKDQSQEPDQDLIYAFNEKMENDFDVAGAIAEIFKWMDTNPSNVQASLEQLDSVLGILPIDFSLSNQQAEMISHREAARQNKEWKIADQIRDELLEDGIEIEDTPEGPFAKPRL